MLAPDIDMDTEGDTAAAPSHEAVVRFVGSLESVDVEAMDEGERECGICRGEL